MRALTGKFYRFRETDFPVATREFPVQQVPSGVWLELKVA
jgi:hypothetical protein